MKVNTADMGQEYLKRIKNLRDCVDLLHQSPQAENFLALTERCMNTLTTGGQIFFMGNGGSAAEASHIAAEFVSKCCVDHSPWPALALNESISAITAIGNDFGFEEIFARQVKAFCNESSVVIGLSTSGKSENVIAGLRAANFLGAYTSLWTSELYNKNEELNFVNLLVAPTNSTPRAQEIHLLWGHALAEIIESTM